jgi:DNA repair protein RAD5
MAETDAPPEPSLPVVETTPWDAAAAPPAERLRELRVWRCSGAPCHDDNVTVAATRAAEACEKAAAAAARARGVARLDAYRAGQQAKSASLDASLAKASGERRERSVHFELDGMHFCSQLCAEAKFKRALVAQGRRCVVGRAWEASAWEGATLRGKRFDSKGEALEALKAAVKAAPSRAPGSAWEGEPLYPSLALPAGADADAASADATYAAVAASGMARRLPHLSAFPAGAPEGAFIAHLEAAGAPRSYGLHWPCFPGTKVQAALAEVARVRAEGEKLIVFSDCKSVLEVLRDALRRARGDGAVGLILGETNFEARMETLRRFNESPACCALLLSVQACASGLTLTAANHCLLLDLQSHEGRELQLVNRVWRIGQTKPVSVKRLVAAGTVEERMLHLRKRSKGLMASESDADQIAVSRVEEPAASGGGGGAPEQSERTEELRFLFNARVRAEA